MPRAPMWVAAIAAVAVLPALTGAASPPPDDEGPVAIDDSIIVVHTPTGSPVRVDTTALRGPHLTGWWFDPSTGQAVDVGSVRRDVAVPFFPPDTGEGDRGRGWVLVIDDAARTDPAARRPAPASPLPEIARR